MVCLFYLLLSGVAIWRELCVRMLLVCFDTGVWLVGCRKLQFWVAWVAVRLLFGSGCVCAWLLHLLVAYLVAVVLCVFTCLWL